jgi:drug/metabolite transporter (DMT)-like permease
MQGLKDVPPAEAQVIFSSMPLWAAGLTWLLLGGEELGALAWAGGASIVAAGILASTAPSERQEEQQERLLRPPQPPLQNQQAQWAGSKLAKARSQAC